MLSLDEKIQLQENIIDELFENILKKQPKGLAYFNGYLFKKLDELFKLEVNYLGFEYNRRISRNNEIKLEITPKIDKKTLGTFKYKGLVPVITIYTEHDNYYGVLSNDPKRRVASLGQFINTLFHELRHLKQYLLTQQNVSNKNVLRNAKEFLVVTSSKQNLKQIYEENHNDFAIEVDAKIKANSKLKELLNTDYLKVDDNFSMPIFESKRDYNELVFDNVVYNRDALISEIVDSNIQKKNSVDYFKEMPILLKEYNTDGSKKTISDLITNMKNELIVANFIKEEDNKYQIINDIKEFYYELIYNRLEEKDSFELYDAIMNNSKEEVYNLIENISFYFNNEKKRTLKLLREKLNAELSRYSSYKYGKYPVYNDGQIKINTLNNTELIDINEFIKKLPNDSNNQILDILYSSKAFRNRIPNYGTYILKNNTKISVNAFVNNIFLKEYNNLPKDKKGNIPLRFCQILNNYVKTPYEIDFINKCEKVNRASQKHEKLLSNTLKLNVFKNDFEQIDQYFYNYLQIIKNLNKPDIINEVRNYMLFDIVTRDDDIFYSFNEEQLNYFDMLQRAAKYLKYSDVLNPNKIDYLKMFKTNDIIDEINTEIKRYKKINKNTIKL